MPSENYGPKFYGRRKGKALRAGKAAAIEDVLPAIEIAIAPSPGEGRERVGVRAVTGPSASLLSREENVACGTIPHPPIASAMGPSLSRHAPGRGDDPRSLFPFPIKDLQLEIGFGDGEHLLHQALNNPETGFIGCEPFLNGIAALCVGIQKHGIRNIRVWPDDARLLLPALEPESLSRCFILNSDPWPKTRHHKRRFIQRETLDMLHYLLKPGAGLLLSSDHPGLTAWQLEKTLDHGGFAWTAQCAADWRTRPADMPETRYQKKNMAGHPVTFLDFRRA